MVSSVVVDLIVVSSVVADLIMDLFQALVAMAEALVVMVAVLAGLVFQSDLRVSKQLNHIKLKPVSARRVFFNSPILRLDKYALLT